MEIIFFSSRLAAAAAAAGNTNQQAAQSAYLTAEPYLAAGTNIGPVPGYGVSIHYTVGLSSVDMEVIDVACFMLILHIFFKGNTIQRWLPEVHTLLTSCYTQQLLRHRKSGVI